MKGGKGKMEVKFMKRKMRRKRRKIKNKNSVKDERVNQAR